ncbi:MAG: MATE family efflux transporter, partial [Bacteroidota bacterium]
MNREILRLAVPNILSNISVPLISSYDTILMGGLGGEHIAAVGLGSMAFNFVYWNFGFLRMSTTGLTAQAYGKEDEGGQLATLVRAGALALIISVLLLVLQYPLAELTHWLLNLRAEQVAMVDEYFYIRLLAAPAALLQMTLLGWFFGRQNAVFPLVLTVIVNLGNMAMSYYLVRQLDWGIAGVAWGTVAAQYVGLLLGVVLLWIEIRSAKFTSLPWGKSNPAAPNPSLHPLGEQSEHQHFDKLSGDQLRPEAPSLRDFLAINRDIFIRTVCLTLSFIFFYNRANALDVGTAVVAANVILLQLVNWLSYGIDGFAFAAESLIGKYHGADEKPQLKRAVRLIFIWGMGLAGLYALIYGLG